MSYCLLFTPLLLFLLLPVLPASRSSGGGVQDGDQRGGAEPRDRVCGRPDARRRPGAGDDHGV